MKNINIKVAILTIILSTSLFANDIKYGLGWYSASAPVGGRVWFTPQIGLDLGLGYADKNLLGANKDRFHLNIGVPVNVVHYENVAFFIRPGVELQTNARTVAGETKSKLIVSADLGAEWWITKSFTLSVGHGLQVEQVDHASDDNKLGISALRALGFNNLGFHFYF